MLSTQSFQAVSLHEEIARLVNNYVEFTCQSLSNEEANGISPGKL